MNCREVTELSTVGSAKYSLAQVLNQDYISMILNNRPLYMHSADADKFAKNFSQSEHNQSINQSEHMQISSSLIN